MTIYRNKETGVMRGSLPYTNYDEWETFPMKFSAKDHNFVAKRIRENFPLDTSKDEMRSPLDNMKPMIERNILCVLALDFAKHFAEDNLRFDPLKFLDACSPDTDLYPLSELWEAE
jgi:hypothetical protein